MPLVVVLLAPPKADVEAPKPPVPAGLKAEEVEPKVVVVPKPPNPVDAGCWPNSPPLV